MSNTRPSSLLLPFPTPIIPNFHSSRFLNILQKPQEEPLRPSQPQGISFSQESEKEERSLFFQIINTLGYKGPYLLAIGDS